MLDVLQLEIHPPFPLDTFFDPDYLERRANPPKKEPPRFPPATGKKKERESNLEGLQASAKQAALADLRAEAVPEHIEPEVKAPAETKVQHFRRLHDKALVRAVAIPAKVCRKASAEPRVEPASLTDRRRKAVKVANDAAAAIEWLQDEDNARRIADYIASLRLQAHSASTCTKMSEFEELMPMLSGIATFQKKLASKKKR